MAKGISLHIGLNRVNPDSYNGWDGALAGCINDARAMEAIGVSGGFSTTLLLDDQATSARFMSEMGRAAQQLEAGDMLFLTYSGHGGQVPDANGDEDDGKDETWVLYDRMLIDDELYHLWSQFADGVRIVMLSDSCHSGTMSRVVDYSHLTATETLRPIYGLGSGDRDAARRPTFRVMPAAVQEAAYHAHAELYDSLQWATVRGDRSTVGASIILISGCQDNQLSADGVGNGLFTEKLLQVWNNGAFDGSYYRFWKDIQDQMPPTQSPNYYTVGAPNSDFEDQRPFEIGAGSSGSTGSGRPTVHAPQSWPREYGPPTFDITTGQNRYYIVEVAREPSLFVDSRPDGNSDSFYATYYDSDSPARLTSPRYTLPDNAWAELRSADCLYYRIGTTSSQSPNEWDNYTVSTDDDRGYSAASIEIAAENGRTPPRRGRKPGRSRVGAPKSAAGDHTRDVSEYPSRSRENGVEEPTEVWSSAAWSEGSN